MNRILFSALLLVFLTSSTANASAQISKEIETLRSEARIGLGAIYTVEQSYAAENSEYTEQFVEAGWNAYPSPAPFQIGFLSAAGENDVPSALISERARGVSLSDYAKYCKKGCRATKDVFEVLLVMPLDSKNHVDVWTIDMDKNIKLLHDGLTD